MALAASRRAEGEVSGRGGHSEVQKSGAAHGAEGLFELANLNIPRFGSGGRAGLAISRSSVSITPGGRH